MGIKTVTDSGSTVDLDLRYTPSYELDLGKLKISNRESKESRPAECENIFCVTQLRKSLLSNQIPTTVDMALVQQELKILQARMQAVEFLRCAWKIRRATSDA